jgi:hypothetical protein
MERADALVRRRRREPPRQVRRARLGRVHPGENPRAAFKTGTRRRFIAAFAAFAFQTHDSSLSE